MTKVMYLDTGIIRVGTKYQIISPLKGRKIYDDDRVSENNKIVEVCGKGMSGCLFKTGEEDEPFYLDWNLKLKEIR